MVLQRPPVKEGFREGVADGILSSVEVSRRNEDGSQDPILVLGVELLEPVRHVLILLPAPRY
jgi:hypothetical protein